MRNGLGAMLAYNKVAAVIDSCINTVQFMTAMNYYELFKRLYPIEIERINSLRFILRVKTKHITRS